MIKSTRRISGLTALILSAVLLVGCANEGSDASTSAANYPLHAATRNGEIGKATDLINAGEDINSEDGESKTPLMYAASGAVPAIVDLLLAAGADPARLDKEGNSALMHAVRAGNRDAVTTLLGIRSDISTAPAGAIIQAEIPDSGDRTAIEDAILEIERKLADLVEAAISTRSVDYVTGEEAAATATRISTEAAKREIQAAIVTLEDSLEIYLAGFKNEIVDEIIAALTRAIDTEESTTLLKLTDIIEGMR